MGEMFHKQDCERLCIPEVPHTSCPPILTPLFDTKINQDINKRFYDESKLQSKANCGCGKADATDDGNDCTETSHKGIYPNQSDAERMGQAQPALYSAEPSASEAHARASTLQPAP